MISRDLYKVGCWGNWRRYENNPVLKDNWGETYDVTVVRTKSKYRMYLSWRSTKSIAFVEGSDGVHWENPTVVLRPDPTTQWEDDVNRQIVVEHDGRYYMWYTGQVSADRAKWGKSCIGYAESDDGVHFTRRREPVLVPDEPWERQDLMCPHVIWNGEQKIWQMWYSGGGTWEPDAIGYATSKDGIHWKKYAGNPVLFPVEEHFWERKCTTACQVLRYDGWYYMFYIGFEDVFKATVNMARSKDGVTNWQRFRGNPILSGGPTGAWDSEAIYKPWVEHENGRWLLWANGRRLLMEQVGLYIHTGDDLGFADCNWE